MYKNEEIVSFFSNLPNLPYFGNSIHLRKQEQFNANGFWLIRQWRRFVSWATNLLGLRNFQRINHEEFFKQYLLDSGFKETKYFSKINKKQIKKANRILDGDLELSCENDLSKIGFYYEDWLSGKKLFVHEPFGRNSAPDFLLFFYGYVFYIELKSNKGDTIKWNNLPDDGILYLFSSKKFNQSTIFFGNDVITGEIRGLFYLLKTDIVALTAKYKNKFHKLDNPHGWSCSTGAMFCQQVGGKNKTSVIGHPRKQELEEAAINRIKENLHEDSNNNGI